MTKEVHPNPEAAVVPILGAEARAKAVECLLPSPNLEQSGDHAGKDKNDGGDHDVAPSKKPRLFDDGDLEDISDDELDFE